MTESRRPQPARGIVNLLWLLSIGVALFQAVFSSGLEQVVGVVMLGLALAAVLLYAWIQRYGSEADRALFPPPRQLAQNTRDDLRHAGRWFNTTWHNIGRW